jgi:SET and MYND domain-containing protein
MINHSCDPNAFVFFEGHELRVRSLKQIAAGEEITICYLNPTLDVGARQVVLRHEYFFDCYCEFYWSGHRCPSD